MKRKLIDFEAFKQIKEDSLTSSEAELIDVESVLAKALDIDQLKMHCFGESDVVYQTLDNNYVHATYHIKNNNLIFENIEEMIVDENTAKTEAKKILSSMVEDLINDNETKAAAAFTKYLSLPLVRKSLMEGTECPPKDKKDKKKKKKFPFDNFKNKFSKEPKYEVKAPKKKIKEWANLSENVSKFVEFQEFGPVLNHSELRHDDKGNVIAVRIPTSHARNEGKILNLTYKNMLDTEVKVLRAKIKAVSEEAAFGHAMADLRRANAVSDTNLQQIVDAVVTKWPELLYLGHSELSKKISESLEAVGETNYDDAICDFLAEGILRTAVNAYSERVDKIARLCGHALDKENVYESYQEIIAKFFPRLDESTRLEMQVFVDLYNSLVEVFNFARTDGNEALLSDANDYLKELHAVLNQEARPDVNLAGEVASWLRTLVETNLDTKDWDVSNDTYKTVSGDNPQMNKNAQKGYTPSSDFSGDWGDSAPVSDGKSYKGGLADEMRNRGFGNWGSDETYPSIKNPYVPAAKEFTMKGGPGVDKSSDELGQWQSGETWPALQNNNVKSSPWRPETYKMKSDDLIVDK